MRKFLYHCFFLLFFSGIQAQTIEELDKQLGELFQKRDFKNAIIIAKKLLEETRIKTGEDHADYASSLSNLGVAYAGNFQFDLAESLYIKAIEIRKKILGENHPQYAGGINNLGTLYFRAGKYDQAKSLLLQAVELRKKILGDEHPDCLLSLHNLADVYNLSGEYEKAEPLYIRVIALRKKVLGEEHPFYAISLNNLALLYMNLGQYEKTEQLYIQAKEIQKRKVGENHADYTTGLNNLADLYRLMGNYNLSEEMHLKALDIRRNTVGENHTNFAQSMGNLSLLYSEIGDYIKAEAMLLQAIEIQKKIFGEIHPVCASNLNNLAVLYTKTSQFEKAEKLFIQALDMRKFLLGEGHTDYFKSLNDLVACYNISGQYEKAEPFFNEAATVTIKNLGKIFTVLSEKEKGNYLSNRVKLLDIGNSLLFHTPQKTDKLLCSNFNMLLFLKSLSLTDTKNMLQAVRNSTDTTIQMKFNRWLGSKNLLARQYAQPVNGRAFNIDSLEANAEELEKDLSRNSFEFRIQQSAMQVSLREIREALHPNEAAIEFVRFRLFNNKKADSINYAAYVVSKNDSIPHFVPLFEEKQLLKLQQLLGRTGKISQSSANIFYPDLTLKDKNTKQGEALYKLIWQPLEPYLEGIKKISYSPAGKLFSIAFNALFVGNDSLLIEKYQLQQYTSTRQVALRNVENQTIKPANITLFGNANFSMDSMQLTKQRTDLLDGYVSRSIYLPSLRGGGFEPWGSLPGTAQEVNSIKQLFDKNKIATRSFAQTAASEENLKALSGNSPQVLHIATHGFFLPEPNKAKKIDNTNVYTLADDPLLRTGLVLSGGNYAWSGKAPVEGVEDGIVTAYEISQLNLSNTELVVLSACETALGDVKGSEGVFGLQRAFKMAGVKKMIVSLWRIPDKETAELMTSFYTYWMKGNTINEAFAKAQADMRKKYSPFYWAAFVLVE